MDKNRMYHHLKTKFIHQIMDFHKNHFFSGMLYL